MRLRVNQAFDQSAAWLANHLAGEWRSRRRLVDHRARSRYTFKGGATITADRFVERGYVSTEGRSFQGSREYRLEPSHGLVRVFFPDGRLFVDVRAVVSQTLMHQCGDDLYRGRVIFIDHDRWIEQWRVLGPNKRYSSLTRFERVRLSG